MIEIQWREPKRATTTGIHRLTATGTNGLAKVHAEWFSVSRNALAGPPSRVTITRMRRPGERGGERGVTSPVLADAQPILTRMTQELPEQTKELNGVDPMDEIRERVQRMPAGPREDSSRYYAELLDTFRRIEAIEPKRPVQVLAELTGKPESTLHLHLRKAREHDAAPLF